MNDLRRALVVSTGKNAAWIVFDAEAQPRVAGLRRMVGKRSMPVPGDIVFAKILEDGKCVIERVEPRAQTLERRSVDGRSKTMAANVDTLIPVTAFADPPPRLVTLDQLLAFAQLQGTDAMPIFTKPDLGFPAESAKLVAVYAELGYRTLVINPKGGTNVDDLRAAIAGRRALLCGVSGVGKSTIFKALGGEGNVGEVSRFGQGRQTTSAARLYRMGDGFLIDSPGVSEFGLGAIEAAELTQGFRELPEAARGCRFNDCTHLQEPDCGVKAGVAEGRIAASRYHSYRKILTEPS